MNLRRKPLYFLLINVFLSLLITGIVLLIYDRAYRRDCGTTLAVGTSQGSTSFPLSGQVDILGVIAPGSYEQEVVLLQNDGSDSLVLTGWYLESELQKAYTFPQLTLYPGGLIKLHTTEGVDNATDLYLDSSTAQWRSGQLVVLYDTHQTARAIYRIP